MRFATLAFPCFNVFHDMFYEGNIKIIERHHIVLTMWWLSRASLLTPRALAFWIHIFICSCFNDIGCLDLFILSIVPVAVYPNAYVF
jgi:hypothetical protein